jgi:hypothetical protein
VQFQTVYDAASGPSHLECAFIARRFDVAAGYVPGESESLIVTARLPEGSDRARMATQIGTRGHYTGVWRTLGPSARIWACAHRGWVGHRDLDAPADARWEREKLSTQPRGMAGVDEGPHAGVYVWGAVGAAHAFYRSTLDDDGTFESLPTPNVHVEAVAGDADGLLAVGEGGAARWMGDGWETLPLEHESPLVAAAVGDGTFFAGEGTLEEVGKLPSALPGDLRAIARWRGATWIAAGRLGLWRLDDGESVPVCVRDDCDPRSLDGRDRLVFATSNLVASTGDGEYFKASGQNFVLNARANAPLGDFGA